MFPGSQYQPGYGPPNQPQPGYQPPPPPGGAYPPPAGGAYPPPAGGAYPSTPNNYPSSSGGAYPPPPSGGAYPPPAGGAYPPPPGSGYPQPSSAPTMPGAASSYASPTPNQMPGAASSYPPPPPGASMPGAASSYPPPPAQMPGSASAYPPPPGQMPGSASAYPPPPNQMPGGAPAYPTSSPMPGSASAYNPPSYPGSYPGYRPAPDQAGGAPPANYQQPDQVQLSRCTGRHRALLIGINYFGTSGELRGCINDVKNIKEFLIEYYKFRECDMVVLTDDQTDPRFIPTRANMLAGMQWLVNGAQPDDSFFFHFSGHGGQVKDTDFDEEDGFDETILPVDYQSAGQIIDDEINAIMVRPLPPGCRLTAIFDSCHSGTAMDLPYLYNELGQLVQGDGAKQHFALQNPGQQYMANNMMGAVAALKTKKNRIIKNSTLITQQTRSSLGDVIMFSGCADAQTSADTNVQGFGATGAMSFAFISTLKANQEQTYTMLLGNIRGILKGKFSQRPQMSTGRPMDMNTWFIM